MFIIFDGECALCNRSVMFVLNNDKTKSIIACSNNSIKAKELIDKHSINVNINSTIIYIYDNDVYYKSSAIINIFKQLKGVYPLLYSFILIPKSIRDFVYDFVAKHRKKIIKERESCYFLVDKDIKKRIFN